MNNQTDIGIKFTNKVTNEKKIEKYREELTKIYALLKSMDKGKITAIESTSRATTNMLKEQNSLMKQNGSESEKMAKGFNLAFNYTTLRMFTRAMKGVVSTMATMVNKSSTFVENMNLLDVAFNNDTTEAEKFVNKLSEMYGLDESWGYRTVGIFKQLANAMGVAGETGTKLSQVLTQLSIDTSSLYNIDTDEAVSIFRSALAGQTKPPRRLGADITQTSLQETLNKPTKSLADDLDNAKKSMQEFLEASNSTKLVSNLNYAEKRLLIVASLLRQLEGANNDWGRTIESVANQTRILSDQWERLNRAVGNVFLPIIEKVLPYLNAILMVFTEIISSIATLVGYDPKKYDYFSPTTDEVIDLQEGLEGANASAKKLNSSLRSFDKLNNITTNKGTGAGVGGGMGISPEIMKLFNDEVDKYNSKLTDVQMKATKIRDRIMEWLGFTKQVDEKTGDVSFKFEHVTGGTVLGALAIGGSIFNGVRTVLKLFEKIGLLKFGNITKLSSLFTKSSFTKLATGSIVIGGIIFSAQTLSETYKNNEEFRQKIDKVKTSIENFAKSIGKLYEKLRPIIEKIMKILKELGKVAKTVLESTVIRYFTMMIDRISGILDILTLLIDGDFKGAFKRLGQMATDLWNDWKKAFEDIIDALSELPAKFVHWAGETAGKFLKKLFETDWTAEGKKIVTKIIDGMLNFGSSIKDWVTKFIDKIVASFKDGTILTKLKEIGTSIIKAILNAMIWPASLGASVISKFVSGMKDALGLNKNTSKTGSSGDGYTAGDGKHYATGGLPSVGQLMYVNERGPELVGQVGGQSFVANQSQIVDFLDRKIGNAQTNQSPQVMNFYLDANNKLATYTLDKLQNMAKSNGQPIEIGG